MIDFYMMVGLPASGKSTVAENLGVVVRSSDDLRVELLGDVNDMSDNSSVFDVLHSLIKSDLYRGQSVVYDATNLKSKYRKAFLESIKLLPCRKICIFMNTPYAVCWNRNNSRSRVVPFEAMERMKNNLEPPTIMEGWDEIRVMDCIYKEDKRNGGDR